MPTLEIDGIGKVEVEPRFLQLTPQQQAVEVDSIVAQIKGTPLAPAVQAAPPVEAWREAEAQANLAASTPAPAPAGDDVATRGTILPLGRTADGKLILAVPEAIAAPFMTSKDILEERKGIGTVTGEDMASLAAFTPFSPASGTGKGIAAAAAGKAMVGPVKPATVPPVPPAGQINILGYRPGAEAARTVAKQTVRTAKDAAFKAADESGAVISNARMTVLRDAVYDVLTKGKIVYDPDLHPTAKVPLKRLEQDVAAGDVTFSQVDRLRKLVTTAERDLPVEKKSEMAVLQTIKGKIDEMVDGLSSKDVVAGDATAVQSLIKANKLASQEFKLDTIATMLDRATTTAGQTSRSTTKENAIINEFKNLAKNQGAMKSFTPDEQKLIKLVARGGSGEKVARQVARLAPSGPGSIFFSGGIGGYLGGLAGGPLMAGVGSLTTLTAGQIGRKVAQAILNRNIRELEMAIASGGKQMKSDAISKARSVQKRLGAVSGLEAGD